MIKEEQIIQLVFAAIDETNEQVEVESRLERSEDESLFGESSKLDSLGFISLITTIEESIDDELGFVVSIVDEKAMSQEVSPFQTVGTLIGYIVGLLNEEN